MRKTIVVPAYGSADSYARFIQYRPAHAVLLLAAIRDLDDFWDFSEPLPEDGEAVTEISDPKQFNAIVGRLRRLLEEVRGMGT